MNGTRNDYAGTVVVAHVQYFMWTPFSVYTF